MRLDDFDPNINVEDQRGSGGFGGGGGGGLLLGLLPMIGSRFGCGGIVVVLIVLAVFGGLGNIGSILGGTGPAPSTRSAPREVGGGAAAACGVDALSKAACDSFSSAENTWEKLFAANNRQFTAPKLVFFGGQGRSGCGAAQAAMGPFYCPTDNGIYLDTSFFRELETRFKAEGDFAQDYVIAHEFGHHIQTLLGTSQDVRRRQAQGSETQGNALSVRLELQADCYAGVWAAQNRNRMEPGDLQEGMTAAAAIGDDALTQGRVSPDSFTHGTSAQRQAWLTRGLESGDPAQCDTFSGAV